MVTIFLTNLTRDATGTGVTTALFKKKLIIFGSFQTLTTIELAVSYI